MSESVHRRCVTCLKFKPAEQFLEGRLKCNRCRRVGLTRAGALTAPARWAYPLAPAARAKLLLKQQGHCAICQEEEDADQPLVVDHDHATGFVRALLCQACNHGLGRFRDDPARLQRAIDYLTALPPASGDPWEADHRRAEHARFARPEP